MSKFWKLWQESVKNLLKSGKMSTTEFKFQTGEKKFVINIIENPESSSFDLVGHIVWASSFELINAMQLNRNIVRGKTILELGSGTGICGIAAVALGAKRVVLTDWKPNRKELSLTCDGELEQLTSSPDSSTLSMLQRNVHLNSNIAPAGIIHIRELEWGNTEHCAKLLEEYGRFDTIIGSEVLYTQGCASAIIMTLPLLMHPQSTALLVSQLRFNARGYLNPSVLASAGLRTSFAGSGKFDHFVLSLSAPGSIEAFGQ
jgi:predicted nicotinamide N-methyase